jgi:hypothetical protein
MSLTGGLSNPQAGGPLGSLVRFVRTFVTPINKTGPSHPTLPRVGEEPRHKVSDVSTYLDISSGIPTHFKDKPLPLPDGKLPTPDDDKFATLVPVDVEGERRKRELEEEERKKRELEERRRKEIEERQRRRRELEEQERKRMELEEEERRKKERENDVPAPPAPPPGYNPYAEMGLNPFNPFNPARLRWAPRREEIDELYKIFSLHENSAEPEIDMSGQTSTADTGAKNSVSDNIINPLKEGFSRILVATVADAFAQAVLGKWTMEKTIEFLVIRGIWHSVFARHWRYMMSGKGTEFMADPLEDEIGAVLGTTIGLVGSGYFMKEEGHTLSKSLGRAALGGGMSLAASSMSIYTPTPIAPAVYPKST